MPELLSSETGVEVGNWNRLQRTLYRQNNGAETVKESTTKLLQIDIT